MGSAYTKQSLTTVLFPAHFEALPSQAGRTLVITGTTSGIGFITARSWLLKGGTVYGLNRPSERSKKAKTDLTAVATTGKYVQVDCDLQDTDSIDRAITELNSLKPSVQVVACNAGVMALKDVAAKSGYDVQIQTNHFGHFRLIKGVFHLMSDDKDSRIVMHSSMARRGKPIMPEYFEKNSGGKLGGDGASMFFGGARWKRYQQSKLSNVVLSLALNDRLRKSDKSIVACACAPGLASTELQHTTHVDGGFSGYDYIWKFGQSAEDGAIPFTHCCMGKGVEGGDFFEPVNKGGMSGPFGKKKLEKNCVVEKDRDVLWGFSEEACGKWDL